MKTHKSNTYDLIVESESEDKGRTIAETLIYTIIILSAVVSIVRVAAQPVIIPDHVASKYIVCQDEQPC
jgi:hypothetical protein